MKIDIQLTTTPKEKPQKGDKWNKSTIRWMLKNVHYDGKVVFGRKKTTVVFENGKKVKGGYQSVMDKRTDTINKKYGTNFTTDELQRFFNSRKQAKLQEQYGSDQMFTIASKLKEIPTTKKDMKDYIQKNISLKDLDIDTSDYKNVTQMFNSFKDFMDLTGDPVLDEFVASALGQGFSAKNLFALFI